MGRTDVRVRNLGVGTTLDENVYTSDGKTQLLKKCIDTDSLASICTGALLHAVGKMLIVEYSAD
jgi:hypothetical protein